jgi:EAL domain-containing protein (putative c-di-GMP-specific phosphodiesterase class I)
LKVAAALSASGLAANRLELEITEAVLIRDDETALTILHQIRASASVSRSTILALAIPH